MPNRRDTPPLTSPHARFAPTVAARVEQFAGRMNARLARRDEFGRAPLAAQGHDFVGYRAYHAGDDPRTIDWNATARSERPLVRLSRREAGERWVLVLDASASMGLGSPGKLQLAAETAAALALVARRRGAEARVCVVPSESTVVRAFDVGPRTRVSDLLAFLESIEASGRCDGADFARAQAGRRGAARVFVLSDCLSARPGDVIALGDGHAAVSIVRILAPHELGANVHGDVEWVDPESGARVRVDVDARVRGSYEAELGAELETWRRACGRGRVRHDVHESTADFEDVAARALERGP